MRGLNYGLKIIPGSDYQGLHPKERAVMIDTDKGQFETYTFNLLEFENSKYIPCSKPLSSKDGRVLVEMQQETADGRRRVYVQPSDLIGLIN